MFNFISVSPFFFLQQSDVTFLVRISIKFVSYLEGLCEKPCAPSRTHRVWKILVDCAGPFLSNTAEKET
jgi:hypothetical protein